MIFKELDIRQKIKIGSGTYKDVYDLETYPGFVAKKFSILDNEVVYDVQEEEEISKKYPELFTQIKKVDYKRGYMVQEKVNATQFENDIDVLKKEIVLAAPSFKPIDIVSYLFRHLRDNNKEAIKAIKDILKDNNNKKFYNKLITYLSKLSKVKRERQGVDVHRENFGYDKQGNIKMLDI
jgi:hypothetical protein